jgi:hypothetical protein
VQCRTVPRSHEESAAPFNFINLAPQHNRERESTHLKERETRTNARIQQHCNTAQTQRNWMNYFTTGSKSNSPCMHYDKSKSRDQKFSFHFFQSECNFIYYHIYMIRSSHRHRHMNWSVNYIYSFNFKSSRSEIYKDESKEIWLLITITTICVT